MSRLHMCPLRIMTIGDSITDYGNAFRRRLGDLLDNEGRSHRFVGSKGRRIQHEGHSGAMTADIARSIAKWTQAHQPNVVLLMIGTNDVWKNLSLDEAIENLVVCVDQILRIQIPIQIFVAKILPMQPQPENVLIFNELLEKSFKPRIHAGEPIQIVDMYSGFDIHIDLKDGVHPNDIGYNKIAQRWFEKIGARSR